MAEPVLVTGATGHVGRRVLDALRERDVPVRAMSRSSELPGVETVQADVLDRGSLRAALDGARAAYYLVHSLESAGDVDEEERQGAENFAAAAAETGVERIVYLGGLAHDDDLSPHMRSRQAVGEVLRGAAVPAVELRASIVIGEGSASFELVRTLVDNAPMLPLPDWIDTPCQPIAIDDVVAYLVAALDVPLEESTIVEIGGADRATYRDVIDEYARAVGAAPVILTLPSPPVLGSSAAIPEALARLVPERARLWAKLVESLRFDSTVAEPGAEELLGVRPVGLREAIARAVG